VETALINAETRGLTH